MVGEQFGPYRLDALLGEGGMGEVYRAYDTVKERTVALKRLNVRRAGDPEFEARFRRESKVAARLQNVHVIPIHDFGEIDGQLYIEMPLVDGVDLAALLADRGGLEPGRAVRIVTQIARALDAAHRSGLVHRDVKPTNVLVTGAEYDEDFAYLIDFGIARSAVGTRVTGTGSAIGTVSYMAPERVTGAEEDHRVDVYALGCLLYETLTGTPPFTGENDWALLYAHVNAAPPKPSERAQVPPALDRVVARAMAKDPDERYPSAGELAAAARVALRGATGPAGTAGATGPAEPHGSSTRLIPDARPAPAGDAPATTLWTGPPEDGPPERTSDTGPAPNPPAAAGPDTAGDPAASTRHPRLGILLLVLAVVSAAAIWWGTGGPVGRAVTATTGFAAGLGATLLPLVLLVAGLTSMTGTFDRTRRPRLVTGSLLVSLGALGLVHLASGAPEYPDQWADGGGLLGYVAAAPLTQLLTAWISVPVLALVCLYGVLVSTATPLREAPDRVRRLLGR